jgi:hypothetical protein
MSNGHSGSNGCGSCLAAPFVAIWRLLLAIISIVGRLAAALIGIVLVIVGVVLSLTVIGALIGIPLIIFGVMLMARALF